MITLRNCQCIVFGSSSDYMIRVSTYDLAYRVHKVTSHKVVGLGLFETLPISIFAVHQCLPLVQ